MWKSACCLASGAEPVSWLLFSDEPVTGPSPVAIGEGPHRRQRSRLCMETVAALVSEHPLLLHYLASLKKERS